MWFEFGVEDPHITSLNIFGWTEVREVKSHNFRRGVHKILPLSFVKIDVLKATFCLKALNISILADFFNPTFLYCVDSPSRILCIITNSMHCLSSVYWSYHTCTCFGRAISPSSRGTFQPGPLTIKLEIQVPFAIYTFYLLMMGCWYAGNM
jgi:hypothetical protein